VGTSQQKYKYDPDSRVREVGMVKILFSPECGRLQKIQCLSQLLRTNGDADKVRICIQLLRLAIAQTGRWF